jgi:hypothetical protein
MPTLPKFKPASTDAPADAATKPRAGTALGAAPQVAGKAAPSRRVRGGTLAKAEHAKIVADRKSVTTGLPGRPKTSTRDALVALQYTKLTEAAPAILNRMIQGALDPGDPFHEKCLDLVGKRLMPLAFWDGLGKQEFKDENEGGNRPVFVINVGTASLPTPTTVDVVPRDRGDGEE